jgi:hypothetical protein
MKKCIIFITALIYSVLGVNMPFADANTWTQKTNFGEVARDGAARFSIGSKGYIGTGWDGSLYYSDFWEYDPAADTWTQMANFGGVERYNAVGFSIGSKGYMGTGYNDSSGGYDDFWEYNPDDNKWTQKADFGGGGKRDSSVGFSIGNKGYIGTGLNDSSEFNDFWEYDPAVGTLGTWTQKADFGGVARDSAIGFSIGNKGYIGTGWDSGSDPQNDFWEYDPDTDKWTEMAPFGGAARYSAVGFSIGSKGYIGVGTGKDLSNYNDFWEYDPDTDKWTEMAPFGGAARYSAVGFSIGTKGYIGTGYDDSLYYKDFWEYDPAAPASSDGGGGGGCFIATAAFGSPLAGQVETLRQFRDRYLLTNDLGSKFVAWYYRNGPAAASYIEDKPLAKAAVRAALYPLIGFSLLLINGILPYLLLALTGVILFLRFRSKKLSAT